VRHARLNLDVVYALGARWAKHPAIRPHLRYRANTTIRRVGTKIRHYAIRVDDKGPNGGARTYPLCDLTATPYMEAAIEAARSASSATIDELAGAIVDGFPGVESRPTTPDATSRGSSTRSSSGRRCSRP
jgi:hypothetical protein